MNIKTKLIPVIILALFIFVFPQPADAQSAHAAAPDPLCLPGIHQEAGNCQQLGPSGYLARMKEAGLYLPLTPLPSHPLPPEYSELPFYYARLVGDEAVPTYTSIEDAIGKVNPYQYIEPGYNFVSYIQVSEVGAGRYYMIAPGVWVRGGDTAGRVVPSTFAGLLFDGTPKHRFGWILFAAESQREPGLTAPKLTGRSLARFDIIQVYESREVDGVNWYMIGPDEWIEGRFAALVYPTSTPPEGVTTGRWIEINLYEQTISVYEHNRLIFASLVSTGVEGWWTRPGLFQIYEKVESTPMSGFFETDRSDYYYLEDVPWTMYFDQSRALHGAYWHNYFGYEQSHGCANLSPGDARWLYYWAALGDFVYIWDPSGNTPTDPALYTAGGA
jgi:hypothetical protein